MKLYIHPTDTTVEDVKFEDLTPREKAVYHAGRSRGGMQGVAMGALLMFAMLGPILYYYIISK